LFNRMKRPSGFREWGKKKEDHAGRRGDSAQARGRSQQHNITDRWYWSKPCEGGRLLTRNIKKAGEIGGTRGKGVKRGSVHE